MRNAAMLYCPNPTCQAANAEDHKFCHKCSTVLPHRYLWALGDSGLSYRPGDLVVDRYLCKQPRVFLDTRPGLLSATYSELPEPLLPYLRLVFYQLHVPQVYDWIQAGTGFSELVLLDQVPLYHTQDWVERKLTMKSEAHELVQLLPTLTSQWSTGSPLRQLNWLWQIANLWQPLSSENAAGSLLDADLVRIEGSLIRLLELRFSSEQPQLPDLGRHWLQWAEIAHPEVSDFLTHLGQGLVDGKIHNAELLVSFLDNGLTKLSRSQTRQVDLATLTDQGPTRQRNEDACYPASGTQTQGLSDRALLIVCDGIGGHQGGDVASHLAITTLEQRVKALDLDRLDSTSLSIELEKAVCAANDQISQRNDQENRFERQRMGTTVVMALVRDHELYITHVGDSRAYWITPRGCHQITLDDDVASREVRLGYSFYRQALHQPSAGSLVQALGMGTSSLLYPTVQRFIPDEDGLLLLCSDGLSDNDRIEEIWESDILPVLDGQQELAVLSRRLVEIANTRNGYDNVTVGLIHYRVAITHPVEVLSELPAIQMPVTSQPAPAAIEDLQTELVAPPDRDSVEEPITTEVVSSAAKPNFLPLMLKLSLLIAVAAGIGAILPIWRSTRPSIPPESSPSAPLSPDSASLSSLEVGNLIQVGRSTPSNSSSPDSSGPDSSGNVLRLVTRPQNSTFSPAPSSAVPASPQVTPSAANPTGSPQPVSPTEPETAILGVIPDGSILEVLRKQNLSQQESWVELRVCTVGNLAGSSENSPEPSPLSSPLPSPSGTISPAPVESIGESIVQTGQTGWIRETEILPHVTLKPDLLADQPACR